MARPWRNNWRPQPTGDPSDNEYQSGSDDGYERQFTRSEMERAIRTGTAYRQSTVGAPVGQRKRPIIRPSNVQQTQKKEWDNTPYKDPPRFKPKDDKLEDQYKNATKRGPIMKRAQPEYARRLVQEAVEESRTSRYEGARPSPNRGPQRSAYQAKPRPPNQATQRPPNQATQRPPNQATQRSPYQATQTKRQPNQATKRQPNQDTKRQPNQATQRSPYQATQRSPYQATQRQPRAARRRSPCGPVPYHGRMPFKCAPPASKPTLGKVAKKKVPPKKVKILLTLNTFQDELDKIDVPHEPPTQPGPFNVAEFCNAMERARALFQTAGHLLFKDEEPESNEEESDDDPEVVEPEVPVGENVEPEVPVGENVEPEIPEPDDTEVAEPELQAKKSARKRIGRRTTTNPAKVVKSWLTSSNPQPKCRPGGVADVDDGNWVSCSECDDQPSSSDSELSDSIVSEPEPSAAYHQHHSCGNQPHKCHVNQPQGSRMNQQQGSHMNQQQGSHMNQPQGSHICQPQGSHMNQAQGSRMYQAQGSRMYQAQGSRMYQAQGSHMNQPQASHLYEPEESHMYQPCESHMYLPPASHIYQPRESHMNQTQGSHMYQTQGSHMNQPQGSHMNQPQGSHMNQTQGSRMYQAQGSRMYQAQGSHLNQPQGSHMNQPQGSHLYEQRVSEQRGYGHREMQPVGTLYVDDVTEPVDSQIPALRRPRDCKIAFSTDTTVVVKCETDNQDLEGEACTPDNAGDARRPPTGKMQIVVKKKLRSLGTQTEVVGSDDHLSGTYKVLTGRPERGCLEQSCPPQCAPGTSRNQAVVQVVYETVVRSVGTQCPVGDSQEIQVGSVRVAQSEVAKLP